MNTLQFNISTTIIETLQPFINTEYIHNDNNNALQWIELMLDKETVVIVHTSNIIQIDRLHKDARYCDVCYICVCV